MRILCLSDIHGRFGLYRPETLPDADMVVVAGDLTHWGRDPRGGELGRETIDNAREWVEALSARYQTSLVYVVAGNHDINCGGAEFGRDYFRDSGARWEIHYSDGPVRIITASLCTAFDMPELAIGWAHTTADPSEDLAFWRRLSWSADIVVSHCPPHGILDKAGRLIDAATMTFGNERHIGSPGLWEYIERFNPRLVVCGHCHESRGHARVNGYDDHATLVVNAAQAVAVVEYDTAELTTRLVHWEVRKP